MAKAKLDSVFGHKKVTPAQYIAETMCQRLAEKEQKEFPIGFWQDKEWKSFYLFQIRLAYGLLRRYDYSSIMEALSKVPFAYSLNLKQLHVLIEQIHYAKNKEVDVDTPRENVTIVKRKDTKKKNLIEALNEF